MQTSQVSVSRWLRFALAVLACASMSACSTSWQEEVLLHDGSKVIAKRTVSRGGRHEIGQMSPIKEQSLSFALPSSNKHITWEDPFSGDIGSASFLPMLLDISKGIPYIVASPMGCLAYNKWGRPNPPYVIFKHDGKNWQRISLQELPDEIKTPNILSSSPDIEAKKLGVDIVSADFIKQWTSEFTQPEYKTILREPVKGGEGLTICPDYSSQQYMFPRAPAPITAPESGRAGPQP